MGAQLNLLYLPSSADQVRLKLAQLRFIKSVFVARATGTTPLIPSAGLRVHSAVTFNAGSEESGLFFFPPFPSMGRFKRLLERRGLRDAGLSVFMSSHQLLVHHSFQVDMLFHRSGSTHQASYWPCGLVLLSSSPNEPSLGAESGGSSRSKVRSLGQYDWKFTGSTAGMRVVLPLGAATGGFWKQE